MRGLASYTGGKAIFIAGKGHMREPLRTIVLGLLVLIGAYLALAVYEAMPHFSIVIGGH